MAGSGCGIDQYSTVVCPPPLPCPTAHVCSGGLWCKLVKQMSLSPSNTLLSCSEDIVEQLFDTVSADTLACGEGVRSMALLGGCDALRAIVNKMVLVMMKHDIIQASKDDAEIMVTPPTQLWHNELRQL